MEWNNFLIILPNIAKTILGLPIITWFIIPRSSSFHLLKLLCGIAIWIWFKLSLAHILIVCKMQPLNPFLSEFFNLYASLVYELRYVVRCLLTFVFLSFLLEIRLLCLFFCFNDYQSNLYLYNLFRIFETWLILLHCLGNLVLFFVFL